MYVRRFSDVTCRCSSWRPLTVSLQSLQLCGHTLGANVTDGDVTAVVVVTPGYVALPGRTAGIGSLDGGEH